MSEENGMFKKQTIKSLGGTKIGGYLAAFGSAVDTDFQGEYFTKDTNFELDWYKERPVLYGHGLDAAHKTTPIGRIYKLEIQDDAGLWAEAELQKSFLHQKYVEEWIREGRLGWSSGAAPWNAEVDKDGFIRTWAIFEGSLTPSPAQPGKTTVYNIPTKHYMNVPELKQAVKELGLEGYNVDELMIKYNEGLEEDAPGAESESNSNDEDKTKSVSGEQVRPIEIHNHIHLDNLVNEQNSIDTIKEEEPMSKEDTKVIDEVKEGLPEAQPAPVIPEPPVAPPVTPEVPAVKYMSDGDFAEIVNERMWARNSKGLNDNERSRAAAGIKQWFAENYLKSSITREDLNAIRGSAKFQDLLNSLADGFNQSEEKEEVADNAEIKALRETVSKLEAAMGEGGKSQLPMNDGKSGSSQSSSYDFIFSPEYTHKQKFLNYDFGHLANYATTYFEGLQSGIVENRFPEEREDALMAALYDAGKEEMPKIKHLLTNDATWQAFIKLHELDRRKTIKANEVMHSTNAGLGAEWIYTLPQAILWRTILMDTRVASQIPNFMMPAGETIQYIDDVMGLPRIIPETKNAGGTENQITYLGTRPVVAPAGTDEIRFKARHIGEQSFISTIEIEDSIIDVLTDARMKMDQSMREGVDWALLNADLYSGNNNAYGQHERSGGSNTDNYGHYGVDVAETTHADALYNIGFEGLIARAFQRPAGKTANMFAGQMNCKDLMRQARRLMNSRYYADRSALRIIMSPALADKLIDEEDFRLAMRYMGNWDAGNTNINMFDGTPIITSENLVLRDQNGRINSAPTNNKYESVVFFRPDRMKMGIRRPMKRIMEVWGPTRDEIRLHSSLRFDFQTIPNGPATIRKPVSVLYGIGAPSQE